MTRPNPEMVAAMRAVGGVDGYFAGIAVALGMAEAEATAMAAPYR